MGLLFDRGNETSVHVIPEGTAAEAAWCEMVMDGGVVFDWADLRWPHRMVLRTDESPNSQEPGPAHVLREAA